MGSSEVDGAENIPASGSACVQAPPNPGRGRHQKSFEMCGPNNSHGVPNTTVTLRTSDEIQHPTSRKIFGVSGIRDFSLFWFSRDQPGAVCACQQHSDDPQSEWSSIMTAKFTRKIPAADA